MKQPKSRPLPIPSPLTQPYWDAAKRGKLAIQRCSACRTYYHLPIDSCPKCVDKPGAKLSFEEVSGKGKIFTHTLVRDTRIQGFADIQPFPVVLVELAEQPFLIHYGNLPENEPSEIKIGTPVELIFVDIGGGFKLPDFRIAKAGK